jgi:hypothetical protein
MQPSNGTKYRPRNLVYCISNNRLLSSTFYDKNPVIDFNYPLATGVTDWPIPDRSSIK